MLLLPSADDLKFSVGVIDEETVAKYMQDSIASKCLDIS